MKRSVASHFMLISSVDSKKRKRTNAGNNPPKQDTLCFVPMEGSDGQFARSATVVPPPVFAE
jgi:hypothetical protein